MSMPNGAYRSAPPPQELGAELARFEREASQSSLLFAVANVLALGVTQSLTRQLPLSYAVAASVATAASVALFTRGVSSARRRKHDPPPSVILYERGLTAPRDDGSTSTVFYADVEHFFVRVSEERPQRVHLVLELQGGERVVIEPGYGRIGALASRLQERISVPRIAEARRVIAGGGRVELFVVELSDRAISIRGAELPWSELDSAQIVDPVAIELRADGRTWRRLAIGDVDHVAVLGALLRDRTRVLGTHPLGILV